MSTAWTSESLLAAINGYRQSRIILTAEELGLWKLLDAGNRTAAEIANACGSDPRATDRLLSALCALGLVYTDGERYRHSDASRRFLSPASDECFTNLGHYSNLWERWSRLTEAVRTGTAPEHTPVEDRTPDWLENFIAAMHHRAKVQAPADVNLIDFHDAASALDLGGGSGAYAMAMVRVKQDLKATVFDLPAVIPITRRYIRDAGLEHRIETLAGDYLTDGIGSGYDVIFLSAIVHSNSPEQNTMLIRKCADALNDGGRLIVQDFIIDEDRVHPPSAALFAINMLVATEAGDTYTEQEVAAWMRSAGLTDIERHDTLFGAAQLHARKRQE
ncbi:MAG: acetylserotonin O-methyltransferase [Bacteroidia bacterium]|nr:acetylserotonin O-methyltransferase [Bacteroidia bacterium]